MAYHLALDLVFAILFCVLLTFDVFCLVPKVNRNFYIFMTLLFQTLTVLCKSY